MRGQGPGVVFAPLPVGQGAGTKAVGSSAARAGATQPRRASVDSNRSRVLEQQIALTERSPHEVFDASRERHRSVERREEGGDEGYVSVRDRLVVAAALTIRDAVAFVQSSFGRSRAVY